MKNKVRVNFYHVLYLTKNEELIRYFWKWYHTHKVKSKNRAARNVLLHYYSTTAASKREENLVSQAFSMKRDIKIAKENIWNEL